MFRLECFKVEMEFLNNYICKLQKGISKMQEKKRYTAEQKIDGGKKILNLQF